jgi:hypothetical protein
MCSHGHPIVLTGLRLAVLSAPLALGATCSPPLICPPPPTFLPQYAEYRGVDHSDYTSIQDWGTILHYEARLSGLELVLRLKYQEGSRYSEEPSPQHEVELTFLRYPPLSDRTAPLEDTGEEDSDVDTGM